MPNTPDISQIAKLAQSPAGKQLLSLIQQSSGPQLQSAIQKASTGDYAGSWALLAPLLSSPEAKKLLSQLEEQK